jgi:hypothetical protein
LSWAEASELPCYAVSFFAPHLTSLPDLPDFDLTNHVVKQEPGNYTYAEDA